MGDKQDVIIDAAIGVFSRYGVKRTTMHDIATEAAVSRQTLYHYYASKDAVLRATIRYMTRTTVAQIEAEWAEATTLGEKLGSLFRHVVVLPFEHMQAMPHAGDLVRGFNAAGKEEIARAQDQYRLMIEWALIPHEHTMQGNGLNAHQLADYVCCSAVAVRHDARDRTHLLELLGSLILLVLKATDSR